MPVAGSCSRLIDRGERFHLNQHDDGGRNRDGRCAVHHDAEGAVVGICVQRMHVRNLDNGNQRKEEEADKGSYRQSCQLCAVFPAKLCLQSCQIGKPILRIHNIGCERAEEGYDCPAVLDPKKGQT
jgi:hypothetical protein